MNEIFDDNFFNHEVASEGIISDLKDKHEINEYNKINIPKLRNSTKLIIHKASFKNMESGQRDRAWNGMISYLYSNGLLIVLKKSEMRHYIDLRYYDFYGIRSAITDKKANAKARMIKFLKACNPDKYKTAKDFLADLKSVKI